MRGNINPENKIIFPEIQKFPNFTGGARSSFPTRVMPKSGFSGREIILPVSDNRSNVKALGTAQFRVKLGNKDEYYQKRSQDRRAP